MTFPGAGAQVYRNEAGEPIGWDYPTTEPAYCDACGLFHADDHCPADEYEDEL